MISIPAVPAPQPCRKWIAAIARLPEDMRLQVLADMEPCTPKRTFRRYRSELEAASRTAEIKTFSWADKLSVEAPTNAVHLAARQTRQKQQFMSKANLEGRFAG